MSESTWREQAKFMREVGAIHAEWSDVRGELALTRLVLGPAVPHAPVTTTPKADGPAKRLMQMHEMQFAASRMKPPFRAPVDPDAAVPRAVRAKREAAADGAKKNPKRGA